MCGNCPGCGKDQYGSDHLCNRCKVIVSCDKHNEIGPMDDGYQYFWIKNRGAMSASDLREIADELDRRNKDWDEAIRGDLSE